MRTKLAEGLLFWQDNILNNSLKKVLVSSTQQRILLTFLFIRPVSCDYYTLRQGLNKIVWGTYFIPKLHSIKNVPCRVWTAKTPTRNTCKILLKSWQACNVLILGLTDLTLNPWAPKFFDWLVLFTIAVEYRAFSVTRSASMQIYWNKKKYLHKKRVQLPRDLFGTPTWPPFHCFGTPIWLSWRHSLRLLHT